MSERLAWHYGLEGTESQTEIAAEDIEGLSKGINSVERRAKLPDSETNSNAASK